MKVQHGKLTFICVQYVQRARGRPMCAGDVIASGFPEPSCRAACMHQAYATELSGHKYILLGKITNMT